MVSALFVNSGILGQRTFARFIDAEFVRRVDAVRATQIVLTEGLTPSERILRRVICQRFWPERSTIRNLDVFRYRAEWHAGLLARRRMRQLYRSGARFDVLHFHRQPTAYASLQDMRRTPSIVSIDCTQRCVVETARHPAELLTYRPSIRRDGAVFRAAKLIITTSEWAAKSVRAEYPDCDTDIDVMRMPVQLRHFDRDWIGQRYRRAADDPAYRPRVLFVGGDFVRKGGEDLLAAWRDRQLGSRAALDIVSGAPIDAALLSEGVSIHRGVTAYSRQWTDLWRAADVFVLPTREEAFGTVFLEAGAAGLPGIGTAIMAIPELIAHERSGFLIQPRDTHALAAALARLLDSAELRRALGTEARIMAERFAAPDLYRDRLAAHIHRLAGR